MEDKSLEPICIKESRSPNCPMYAEVVIEEDAGLVSTMIYLYELDSDGQIKRIINFAWVRNHIKSLTQEEVQTSEKDELLILPTEFCGHPEGKPKFNPDNLEFVWFEEGDGVALFENDEIICIVPYWANADMIPSYSKDCIKHYITFYPLTEDNEMIPKVRKAQKFWATLKNQEDWWEQFQTTGSEILEKYFDNCRDYYAYAIDREAWPPKALLRYQFDDITYLITYGVSIIPQPQVEIHKDNPEIFRRIELGMVIETEKLIAFEKEYFRFIVKTANLPWQNITWLGHGHRLHSSDIIVPYSEDQPYMVLGS